MNEDAPDPMFDYVDPNLQSPLILAVIEDDTLRLQDNNNYNQGDTPLHVAVRQKKYLN